MERTGAVEKRVGLIPKVTGLVLSRGAVRRDFELSHISTALEVRLIDSVHSERCFNNCNLHRLSEGRYQVQILH